MTAEINRLPKQYRSLISAPPLSDFINENFSLHRYVACLAHTAPALLQALASATLELTIGKSRRACILDLSPIRGDRVIPLRRQVRPIDTGTPYTRNRTPRRALCFVVPGVRYLVPSPLLLQRPRHLPLLFHPHEQPLKLCYSVAFFVGFDRYSPPDGPALWSLWTRWS